MRNRILDSNESKDRNLRNILNNEGINNYADIPVTEIMHREKPVTVEELKRILNKTGKMTLRQRVDTMWAALQRVTLNQPEFSKFNFTYQDALSIVETVIVLDSWRGFEMERKAVAMLAEAYPGLTMYQNPKMDSRYSVDIAVIGNDTEGLPTAVLGVQVKPAYYKNTTNPSVLHHKQMDKVKQGEFKVVKGANTLDLYYDRDTKTFLNLDEITATIGREIQRRFTPATSTGTNTDMNTWTTTSTQPIG